MGLFRLLFILAIVAMVYWLWRRFMQAKRTANPKQATKPEPMVRCAHCGVHLPRQHAIASEQQWFCSTEHLKQGSDQGGK
ncbi:PP0621 family protein [Pseudomonas sp.]|uniref:PP0621 family protein n=1 Tax=Pseudomonas sp. TaxID=306 RepID=UPI003A973313